jgi:hypothetical protein
MSGTHLIDMRRIASAQVGMLANVRTVTGAVLRDCRFLYECILSRGLRDARRMPGSDLFDPGTCLVRETSGAQAQGENGSEYKTHDRPLHC